VNADGVLNPDDPLQFTEFYSVADGRADVNHDASVNPMDIATFFESYSCGCNP
jgi:hypothetical protein